MWTALHGMYYRTCYNLSMLFFRCLVIPGWLNRVKALLLIQYFLIIDVCIHTLTKSSGETVKIEKQPCSFILAAFQVFWRSAQLVGRGVGGV